MEERHRRLLEADESMLAPAERRKHTHKHNPEGRKKPAAPRPAPRPKPLRPRGRTGPRARSAGLLGTVQAPAGLRALSAPSEHPSPLPGCSPAQSSALLLYLPWQLSRAPWNDPKHLATGSCRCAGNPHPQAGGKPRQMISQKTSIPGVG